MASASSVEHPTVVHPCPFTVMAAASTKLRSASAAVFDARVSSTVDAPHLIATVLVARGYFAARYPDAIRRVLRGALDANAIYYRLLDK